MLRWLKNLMGGKLIEDAPVELDRCIDCEKLACSTREYADCAARKTHAAELTAMLQAEEGPKPSA